MALGRVELIRPDWPTRPVSRMRWMRSDVRSAAALECEWRAL